MVTTHLGNISNINTWIEAVFEDMVQQSNVVVVSVTIRSIKDQLDYIDKLRYSEDKINEFLYDTLTAECEECNGSGKIRYPRKVKNCHICKGNYKKLHKVPKFTSATTEKLIREMFCNGSWMKKLTAKQYSTILRRAGSKSDVIIVGRKILRDNRRARFIDVEKVVASFSLL